MVNAAARGDTPRLGPTSYLILGLLGLRGRSTPYQLKRAAGRSVTYFWPFPHTQFYAEPERLRRHGLLTVEDETRGRRRKTYTLTDDGRQALIDWLKSPPDTVFEMRDMAVLQLFFSEFMSTGDLRRMAARQVKLYDERLAMYDEIAARDANRRGRERRMAPLTLGVRMAQVLRDFWQEIEAHPPA